MWFWLFFKGFWLFLVEFWLFFEAFWLIRHLMEIAKQKNVQEPASHEKNVIQPIAKYKHCTHVEWHMALGLVIIQLISEVLVS